MLNLYMNTEISLRKYMQNAPIIKLVSICLSSSSCIILYG